MRLPLLLLALLALPACDSNSYDNGYDDGYGDGQDNAPGGTTVSGATFVNFTLDASRYEVNDGTLPDGTREDQRTATYRSRSISSLATRNAVERALATAGDGALVALYIRTYLVSNQSSIADTSNTYSALPVSRSFDQVVLTTGPNGTTSTIPVVGYTASYEYSFNNNDLYFDVVSSAPASDFGANPRDLFDAIVPQATNAAGIRQGLGVLEFRLVTVPARAGKQGVDMTNYAAVARAYGLPN